MTTGFFEFNRIKKRTALIALVTAGLFIAALRTGSVNIAVSKEHITVRTEKLLVYVLVNQASLVQIVKKSLCDFCTLLVRSSSEFIKIDVEPFINLCVLAVIVVAEGARFSFFFQSLSFCCCTVFINTADIKSVITAVTAETCKNIARKRLNDISQMRDIINVW